jgi:predicted aspartyl protease
MGEVRENIILKNSIDVGLARRGVIKDEEIRQASVPMLADTGAWTIVLTEETCKRLGLEIRDRDTATVAGGVKLDVMIADPVEIHWKNRYMTINPRVLPGETDDLLGALPLEDLDLMVDPVNGRLTGAHGDDWVKYIR